MVDIENSPMTTAHKLGFFATPPHDCNYLPEREAVTLFADPHFPKNTRIYTALADCGFRRSGEHLYIPHCSGCSSCIPVRIPVNEFVLSKSQRRTIKKNRAVSVYRLPAEFNEEHFTLYKRYIAERHLGGGMDDPDKKNYMDFLTSTWADTYFYEMRLEEKLIGVAVMDFMDSGISAVYTFFDIKYSKFSPGRFAILYEIEEAKRRGLQWLYLGYWIKGCGKMEYKNEYQPMEYFINNEWTRSMNPKL
jgi:arginyl-tRNA--protein-N-Asp/Glu arginylyltransferase